MPVLKPDRSVRRRHFRELLLLGVPFVGALMLAFTANGFWVGSSLAVVLGLVGLYRQERRLRRSACPTCRAALRREQGKPGDPITFVCSACDTEWDTGLREGSD